MTSAKPSQPERYSPLGRCIANTANARGIVTDEAVRDMLVEVRRFLADGASVSECGSSSGRSGPQVGAQKGVVLSTAKAACPSPLHVAVGCGLPEAAQLLLDYGADPNGRDAYGRTPLHYAGMHNVTNCILLLIQNGADHSLLDEAGQSPLVVALFSASGLAANALNRMCGADAPEKVVVPHSVRYA